MVDCCTNYCAAALGINMSEQSFRSPATRKYGETIVKMQSFKEDLTNMLEGALGKEVVDRDYAQIRDAVMKNFNKYRDLYLRGLL